MTTQTACFTVTGEFLTEHHRSLCCEGNWQKAIADLKTCLIGITTDQVCSVLDGTMKLIGVSDDVDGGPVCGEIMHPKPDDIIPEGTIIVIPNASVRYYEVAKQACDGGGGVIVENGGALAHLSVVGIEQRFTIIRTPNARKVYAVGALVSIDTRVGKVEIMFAY